MPFALGTQFRCRVKVLLVTGQLHFTPNTPAHPWENRRLLGHLGQQGAAPQPLPLASGLPTPLISHSPAFLKMWDLAHTQGCVCWHWARFLRPCLCLEGTWTSHSPSCGREKGGEPGWP